MCRARVPYPQRSPRRIHPLRSMTPASDRRRVPGGDQRRRGEEEKERGHQGRECRAHRRMRTVVKRSSVVVSAVCESGLRFTHELDRERRGQASRATHRIANRPACERGTPRARPARGEEAKVRQGADKTERLTARDASPGAARRPVAVAVDVDGCGLADYSLRKLCTLHRASEGDAWPKLELAREVGSGQHRRTPGSASSEYVQRRMFKRLA